jgi:hypothetical protein
VGVPDEWQEVHKFNFCQIFRSPFGSTNTREAIQSYLGKNRPRIRAEKAIEHAIDIERAYMFGGRSEAGSGPDSLYRTTGGFTFFCNQNVLDLAGAALSYSDLELWLEDVFHHTSSGDSRTLFASPLVVSAFDMLGIEAVRLQPAENTFGLAVNQLVTSHGTLNIVKHRLLENGPGGFGYGNWGFLVDVKRLTNRPLVGRATVLKVDRQSPGRDGWIDEYLTESGLQITNPEVHGIMKNVGRAV